LRFARGSSLPTVREARRFRSRSSSLASNRIHASASCVARRTCDGDPRSTIFGVMDPTERFSARADAYAQARPSYPAEVLDVLRTEYGLCRDSVVADLGSGTGIFTRLLLESGALIYAVEPNADMRAEAIRELGTNQRFRSVEGRAEATTLEDASVDL